MLGKVINRQLAYSRVAPAQPTKTQFIGGRLWIAKARSAGGRRAKCQTRPVEIGALFSAIEWSTM